MGRLPRLPPWFTDVVQRAGRRVGLDVHRWKRSPKYTLLGVRALPIRTVVDVGANEGQFAKWIGAIFPAARVYAFEPLPGPYATLAAWATSRGGSVSTFNVALGDAAAEVEMHQHVDYSYSSSLLPATALNEALFPQTRRQTTIRVAQERLDALVERDRLELVPEVLVKLDVQGFEDRVIAGGRQVFAQARACIAEVSIDELYVGQARFLDLVRLLDGLGLAYAGNLEQSCAPDGHVVFLDAVFVRR